MPNMEEKDDGSMEGLREDTEAKWNRPVNGSHGLDNYAVNFEKHLGVHDEFVSPDETYDQLTQLVLELSLQNNFLKAQVEGIKIQGICSIDAAKIGCGSKDEETSDITALLHEKVNGLNKEIQYQRETLKATEEALQHFRSEYYEADAKVQELSLKVIEAQQLMEREIKERDDKHIELDSKFGRLHKRAKQRIQEVQKEKEDLEARLQDINIKSEQTSSQLLAMQLEVERTRQQANEALRLIDVERQQLRATNNKLRDNIDGLHNSLEAKENVIAGLQQSLFEKEQTLAETQGTLHALEEKQHTSITDLSTEHQKQIESLEAQLADALTERSKAVETITSFQMLLAEKDSKIANMETASFGEAARFGAALEDAKGELIQLKTKHEKEIFDLETGILALRSKLEAAESTHLRSEIEAAKMKSQLDFELCMQKQLLDARDTELGATKDEINLLKKEFSAYKVRAHALLQKKDNELTAARNPEHLKAVEEALEESKTELVKAKEKRDSAINMLHDALESHSKEIAVRDAALRGAENQIKSLILKLNSAEAYHQAERETSQKNLLNIEESWRMRYVALEAEKSDLSASHALKDLEDFKLQYKKLKEEHDNFREIAERTIEKKEEEIAKFKKDNVNLSHSLGPRLAVDKYHTQDSASLELDAHTSNVLAAEQQILLLARQQAQREDELAQSQRHILALQEEIEELERENRLHSQQETMLKEELRKMERSKKREGVDMTYLKNVILKLLETGEVEALLPVIGMLLQFSPEEIRKCQQAYRLTDASSSPAASVDSTPRLSLFSRFSFSA